MANGPHHELDCPNVWENRVRPYRLLELNWRRRMPSSVEEMIIDVRTRFVRIRLLA
jgi:hypothetical protein